jgi:hypothetical protein
MLPMRYAALLSLTIIPLTCSQTSMSVPEPQRAVNFTQNPESGCYMISLLQALIALKSWRNYIFSYPPNPSCTYDKDLLLTLQTFIENYANISATKDIMNINFRTLDEMMRKKNIITDYKFGCPVRFLSNLNTAFTLNTNNPNCHLLQPFKFHTVTTYSPPRYEPSKSIQSDLQLGNMASEGKSLITILQKYCNENIFIDRYNITTTQRLRFASLPTVLWIDLRRAKESFSISLAPILDLAEFCEPPQTSTQYKLISVIWSSTLHYIAYVNYRNIWYLCDDRKSTYSIAKNALTDLARGNIIHSERTFHTDICLYERILTPDEPSPELLNLHSSLQLLSI